MPSDSPTLTLAGFSLAVFATLLTAAFAISLPEHWMLDAFLVLAGVAVGPAFIILGHRFGTGRDSDSKPMNALLVVLYLLLIGMFSYNIFVLEILTGMLRAFNLVVLGMLVPSTLLAAGRATERVPKWAGDG